MIRSEYHRAYEKHKARLLENRGLGLFRDSPEYLARAIQYLKEKQDAEV